MCIAIRKLSPNCLGLFSFTTVTMRKLSIDGRNCTAVVIGGLGFKERQIMRHGSLYAQHDFEVMPITSSLMELTKASVVEARSKMFANQIQSVNKPVAMHAISAGFFTMICTLKAMDKDWRDKYVKSIVFDSCPLATDADGLGGSVAFLMKRHYLKPYLSRLFSPYLYLCGITEDRRKEFDLNIFGSTSVIPRSASILFIYDNNDPAINYDYLSRIITDLRKNQCTSTSVHEEIFENSRHALHLIDNEEKYTMTFNINLLGKVPEWKR